VFHCVLGSEGCVLVPRSSGTTVATWPWPTWVVSWRRVLEALFILLEFPSPSRRIFIGSHSLPPSLVRRIGPSTGSTKTGQVGYQNRSDRFGTTDHTPQKPKMQKKCPSSPLIIGIGSRDAMQLFSTFLSLPCCQCMNQGSNLKICNLELLKYTKFITRCYTSLNEQVRYSTAL
jgi:hypothetical protein